MMYFAHWLTPDIDRHGTCGISNQYTVHDRRCIKTDFIFSSFIHSFERVQIVVFNHAIDRPHTAKNYMDKRN